MLDTLCAKDRLLLHKLWTKVHADVLATKILHAMLANNPQLLDTFCQLAGQEAFDSRTSEFDALHIALRGDICAWMGLCKLMEITLCTSSGPLHLSASATRILQRDNDNMESIELLPDSTRDLDTDRIVEFTMQRQVIGAA
jgi:hypothetical protein